MEKYFVTYNQSLALKELGFDMPCFAYVYTGDTGNNVDRYEETEPSRAINFNHDSLCVSQPLKQQVFEWARNEHKIHCSYGTTSDSREEVNGYCISNFIDGNRNYLHINWEVGTYEEAESACIDKLIEIIKEIK